MNTSKNIKLLIWGCFALVTFGMLAWPVAKWMKKGANPEIAIPESAARAFNSDQGEAAGAPELVMPLRYEAQATADTAEAPAPRAYRQEAPPARTAQIPSGAAASSSRQNYDQTEPEVPATGKQHEREFLRKHDKEIRKYQNRLRALGLKYRAKYPALRKMDAEFGKMDRYMALKNQYAKDGNAYNWARGVMALPEVRSAIIRYSSNPDVVKAMVEVGMEAMKNPPSRELQREMQKFFSGDSKTSNYVNDVLMQSMGNAMTTLATMPGQNIASLQKLSSQILGGNMPKGSGFK